LLEEVIIDFAILNTAREGIFIFSIYGFEFDLNFELFNLTFKKCIFPISSHTWL